jgi:hypothetical protein
VSAISLARESLCNTKGSVPEAEAGKTLDNVAKKIGNGAPVVGSWTPGPSTLANTLLPTKTPSASNTGVTSSWISSVYITYRLSLLQRTMGHQLKK